MSLITFGQNIAAQSGQRQVNQHTERLQGVFERLASGQRINRASDDAAGLAVMTGLNINARVYGQAVLNANDGISLLAIADGTLEQTSSILDRLTELATQAANGTFSRAQRQSLETEAAQLTKEYNRLLATTKFNRQALLDGSLSQFLLQLGFGTDGTLSGALGQKLARNSGNGQFGAAITAGPGVLGGTSLTGDFNRDGKEDLLVYDSSAGTTTVQLSNGDGTLTSTLSFSSTGAAGGPAVIGDFNGDGILDVAGGQDDGFGSNERTTVFFGVGDGTFSSGTQLAPNFLTLVTAGDFNGDGLDDIVASSGSSLTVYRGNSNGTLTSSGTISSTYTSGDRGDFDGDGKLDLVLWSGSTAKIYFNSGSGSFGNGVSAGNLGSFTSLQVADMNYDGLADIVTGNSGSVSFFRGNGNGTFGSASTYTSGTGSNTVQLADYNNDGYLDILSFGATTRTLNIFLSRQDGTFDQNQSTNLATSGAFGGLGIADLDGDGVKDVAYRRAGSLLTRISGATSITSIQHFDLSSQLAARSSLISIATARQRVTNERGVIGQLQSRLSVALASVFSMKEQSSIAASRIGDTDIAQDSAELTRVGILRQAASAVLAQANQAPQIALSLLRG